MKALLLLLLFGGAAVALFQPLTGLGDALLGQGHLFNGLIAGFMMVLAFVLARKAKAQMRAGDKRP
jgi:hypothetical protein